MGKQHQEKGHWVRSKGGIIVSIKSFDTILLCFKLNSLEKFWMCTLDEHFCGITTFIKVHVAFDFGLQPLWLIDINQIYLLKGLKPKNKGHKNFYECCDLTKKVYLTPIVTIWKCTPCRLLKNGLQLTLRTWFMLQKSVHLVHVLSLDI